MSLDNIDKVVDDNCRNGWGFFEENEKYRDLVSVVTGTQKDKCKIHEE